MFRSVSFAAVAVLLLAPAHAHAQDTPGEIDRIFSWATAETPGCAVAVSREGELVVNRAYGSADLERGTAITPGTIFDIGSVQKQFTAASILLLADEGRLSLTDDVRTHIPELPDSGHPITLDHLLTHTSGIRDWPGMLPMAADDPHVLTFILRQRGLNFAPGEEWSYSSSGYELLKEIVARVSGLSFSDFTRTRLHRFLIRADLSALYDDNSERTAPTTDLLRVLRSALRLALPARPSRISPFQHRHHPRHALGPPATYRAVEAPARVVFPERFEVTGALNTLVLEKRPASGTLMRLAIVYDSPEARNAALRTG